MFGAKILNHRFQIEKYILKHFYTGQILSGYLAQDDSGCFENSVKFAYEKAEIAVDVIEKMQIQKEQDNKDLK